MGKDRKRERVGEGKKGRENKGKLERINIGYLWRNWVDVIKNSTNANSSPILRILDRGCVAKYRSTSGYPSRRNFDIEYWVERGVRLSPWGKATSGNVSRASNPPPPPPFIGFLPGT